MTDFLTLSDRFLRGNFVLTGELTPPVSASAADLLAKAEPLMGVVDAVNITDGASARVALSSAAASAVLEAQGVETIAQFTCRDRNRIALMGDLLGVAAQGVNNILVLRGDDPKKGDQPDASGVFDMESTELMSIARDMTTDGSYPSFQKGEQSTTSRTLKSKPNFLIGAADMPTDEVNDRWLSGLKAKTAAGARFVQTQFCYDMSLLSSYAHLLVEEGFSEKLNFLIGNGPLLSAQSASWIRDNLYGVSIPDSVIERLNKADDPKAEGIAICVEQMLEMAELPGISGAHLMAPINTSSIPVVVENFRKLVRI